MTKNDTRKDDGVKKDDPEQSRRFVETARELESDEGGKSFEWLLKKIARSDRGIKSQDDGK